MTPAAVLIAALCITSVVDVPKKNTTMAWAVPAECSPEKKLEARISAAPIQAKPQAKRKSSCKVKLADRCGSMRAVWYVKPNGHRKYRCR